MVNNNLWRFTAFNRERVVGRWSGPGDEWLPTRGW